MSSTQLTALVPAARLVAAGTLAVTVVTGTQTTSAVSLIVQAAPTPLAITAIAPTTATAGVSSVPLTVTGAGFSSNSQIGVAGTGLVTTFVSSTQLSATIAASQLATAGPLAVSVTDAGKTTAAASLIVNNPTPVLSSIAPSVIPANLASQIVTLTGTGFVPTSSGTLNAKAHGSTFVSSTQLTVVILASEIGNSILSFTVTNPSPGGGTSATVPIGVATVPTISSLSPSSVYAGAPATYLQIYNYSSGFIAPCTVQVGSSTLTPSNTYSTALTVTVPASLLTTTGSLSVVVTCSGVASKAATLTVAAPPAPTLSYISTQAIPVNSSFTLTATGSNFTANTTLQLNGTTLPSTLSGSQLTATIPAGALPTPGNYTVQAVTPAPGGGSSAAIGITAYVALPNNSMIYNPANGLLYLSVPGSAGAPYGNSIITVDPATGAIGSPISVGSEPNRLALSADGKILWVGLDNANAVRKVDLTTGTAGYQFSLGGNSGTYAAPAKSLALAALPGSPDSVVVAIDTTSNYNAGLAIYDGGVLRGSATTRTYTSGANALAVDGTRNEIYAALISNYTVYTYNSAGLTLKGTASNGAYASQSNDDLQVVGGSLYSDNGKVYDAEAGALLGTFYSAGTTPATGPTVADTSLGLSFVLDAGVQYSYTYSQIQAFQTADYTTSTATLPVYGLSGSVSYGTASPSHLVRWGANGLAFRTGNGVYSFRSSLVKDLTSTVADLGITLSAPATAVSGASLIYTATVTNNGPSASTGIAFLATTPSNAQLVSATPSQGTCTLSPTLSCSLGSLANGAAANISIAVTPTTAGAATINAQVFGSENDTTSSNNSATATSTITGSAYALQPVISALSPSTAQVGAVATTVTVTGSGFTSLSTVQWNGTALSTTYTNPTTLTATIPSANLASLGCGALTVASPAPGGGTSNALPFTVFNVLTVRINRILYDPWARNLIASVGSGSSTVTGNTIASITPDTGAVGQSAAVGSQPTKMALSDDGKVLYVILAGAASVARFDNTAKQLAYTFKPTFTNFGASSAFRDLAVQPGSEDTIALDLGYGSGLTLVDFTPASSTAALRGSVSGFYSGTSLQFLSPASLSLISSDTYNTLDVYPITSAGFTSNATHTSSTLNNFSSFKLSGGLAFANAGGIADPYVSPAKQIGVFAPYSTYSYSANSQFVAPDADLQRAFFLASTSKTSFSTAPDGILTYDTNTFLPVSALPLNMAAIEGNTTYSGVDLIRWGQDGLAALTSGGHLYLLRGGAVVPGELTTNTSASLSSLSVTSFAKGSGNTILTVTGSNFLRGTAVYWNGSYRTTSYIDANHLSAAIPATDLNAAGSSAITVANPGAPVSSALMITVQ